MADSGGCCALFLPFFPTLPNSCPRYNSLKHGHALPSLLPSSTPSRDVIPHAQWPHDTSSFPCHESHGKQLVSGGYCAGGHLAVLILQSLPYGVDLFHVERQRQTGRMQVSYFVIMPSRSTVTTFYSVIYCSITQTTPTELNLSIFLIRASTS